MICLGCHNFNAQPEDLSQAGRTPASSETGQTSSDSETEQTPSGSETEQTPSNNETRPKESGGGSSNEEEPSSNTLSFTQTDQKHQLDILFIVEQSEETNISRRKLARRFNDFNLYLKNVDWQMAFLNPYRVQFYAIEDENGPVQSGGETLDFLTPDMNNLADLFKHTVDRGTVTSSHTPLNNLKKAFDVSSDFFREDASLAVILLTQMGDDDIHNRGVQFKALSVSIGSKLGHNRFKGYGFLPKGSSCPASSDWLLLHPIKHFIAATGGMDESLCHKATTYSQTLKTMGEHIRNHLVYNDLKSEFDLMQSNIIKDSIQVTFDPSENKQNWNYDAETNKILFEHPPAPGTKIDITYQFSENPQPPQGVQQETFSLTWNPQGKLRLLAMIDHSTNMESHRKKIAIPLKNLVKNVKFQETDWQLAFVNKSPEFSQLRNHKGPIDFKKLEFSAPIVHQSLNGLTELFVETLSKLPTSSTPQTPLANIVDLVSQSYSQNESYGEFLKKHFFMEQEALLAVVILTNKITGEDTTPSQVIASVKNHLGPSKQFVVYSIIIEPNDESCKKAEHPTSSEEGFDETVNALVQQTGGLTDSVCESSYHSFMDEVASDLEDKLRLNNITLRHTNVVESSVALQFDPPVNQTNWQYDTEGNKIKFDTLPEKGTKIEISYDHNPATQNQEEEDQ